MKMIHMRLRVFEQSTGFNPMPRLLLALFTFLARN